jgi:UDP-sugar transporter A1/2/3
MNSLPVYCIFLAGEGGGKAGFFGGWSIVAFALAILGAAGGLLVALSIKYGDSILKTLATTGAIIWSSILDHMLLGGPLTPSMMIAGVQVIISICNYTFDSTPPPSPEPTQASASKSALNSKRDEDNEV